MADLYQEVTDKIVAALESGVAPWVRPWRAGKCGGMPHNAITGKAYRGINVPLLWAPARPSAAWMTYKQAQGIGAQVRKGERGSMIVFYKPFTVTDKDNSDKVKTIPLLRSFTVFNVDQIDNVPAKYLPALEPVESVRPDASIADTMMALATVRHGGDRAFYSPSLDYIQLPEFAQFHKQAGYRATSLHELTHWTGHADRCAREYGKRFGDQAYAREELVAEMGAAFLCAHAGIDAQLEHASYIESWLSVLKADKRAILIAASHAQKAADYVLLNAGIVQPETTETTE
jgi:antirestriction protein ArdC